jgi:Domain of unknown function (DUF4919)
MMRAFITGLVLALALGSALPAAAFDAASEGRYQTLLAAAKGAGDQPVDWQALRFAYADSAEFDLYGVRLDPTRKAMFQALNVGDYKGAIAAARTILDQDYVDVDAHVVWNLAAQQLGDAAAAKSQHAIVVGLLRSIRTGDGSTPAQAFTVITVGEEYAVMRAFGFTVKSQALAPEGGHSYDLLDVVDADGAPKRFYFLTDWVVTAEAGANAEKP